MAVRLGEYVVYGELRNTHHYTTFGVFLLRGEEAGQETTLRVDLTGDCGDDLRGKCFRFWPGENDNEKAIFRQEEHPGFQLMQIGPTGVMTAQGWVRKLPCSVEEFIRRSELGEPPPTPWKRHLYLEWYGQNGRVLVEMADVLVEACVREPHGEEDEGEWEVMPNLALPPVAADADHAVGPEITVIRRDGDSVQIQRLAPNEPDLIAGDDTSSSAILQRALDAESAAIDRAIAGDDSWDDGDLECEAVREAKLMDDCIEHSETQPIASLLGGGRLRPTEELNDEQVEAELKTLLARMATLGIALDVCEHLSPRDCYRLLRDEILWESGAYAELIGTGWVTHISAYEYCKECEAANEAESEDLPDVE